MGSGKKSSSAARRARIEEMRRAEQSRERRNRILMIAASVVIVAGLVVGGVVLVQSQSDDGGSVASDSNSSGRFVTGSDGVKTWKGTLSRNHVTTSVNYPVVPPVGGDHSPVWMNCNGDVYTKAIKNENAVHSLEHGAVWVTYNSKAEKADVDALAAKVKKTPYTLMSPVDGQKDPIMLTAWGNQRTVTGASDPNVDKFFEKFVEGEQTPEPGAACTNGLSQ
jgi:preprotein translocase subunit SecG